MNQKEILAAGYGITPLKLKVLDGYDSINFRVDTADQTFVLKQYKGKVSHDLIAEDRIIQKLAQLPYDFPTAVADKSGKLLYEAPCENATNTHRLLNFVPGTFLAEIKHSEPLFTSFGSFLAKTDLILSDIDELAIKARHLKWDLANFLENEQYLSYVDDPGLRKIAHYYFEQYKIHVQPHTPLLRKSIIHGDANEWNVLCTGQAISGVIDFGDMVYSHTINELGIAIAYALQGKSDPITWACYIIKAYHREHPLTELEVSLLYYLIAARLCTTVVNANYTRTLQPDNEYVSVSEKPAWDILQKWVATNPIFAEQSFRTVCGFENETGANSDALAERHKHFSKSLSTSYADPIELKSACFQYMHTTDGRTYLDAYNNIVHVGHCHPRMSATANKQMATLNTNTRYIYDSLNRYTAKLASLHPEKLSKVFLVNSGSAATDLALRMARHFTGQPTTVVMEHGYHGNTASGIEISDYKFNSTGGEGQANHVHIAPIPDLSIYDGQQAGAKYAADLLEQLSEVGASTFIAEPIIGCGGQVPLPSGYLSPIYGFIRAKGGVCISDEVQVGFGRLGKAFWGYEQQDVVPDIVIMGKPIGSGHPMAAVICTEEIAAAFENGLEFFSSFGGNPVSCELGLTMLEIMEDENLQQHATEVGRYYLDRLKTLQNHDCIGDVRGSGLFIGVEILKDGAPGTETAAFIKNKLKEAGVLISTDGPFDNIIKSKPPMCFSKENVDQVVTAIAKIIQDMA